MHSPLSTRFPSRRSPLSGPWVRVALLFVLGLSAAAQPKIVTITDSGENLTAVRKIGGWFVAVGEQGGVYFTHDPDLSWTPRFGAGVPLADIVHRDAKFEGDDVVRKLTFVLVPADPSPDDPVTWYSEGGLTWQEVHGRAAIGLRRVEDRFVSLREDTGEVAFSADLVEWQSEPGLPLAARQVSGPVGRGVVFQRRYYAWREGQVMSTTDLQHWRTEFSLGSEKESAPVFGVSATVLVAATVDNDGQGPVQIYRRRQDAPWQRLTPDPSWTAVDGIEAPGYGSWLIATSAQGQVRVSSNGFHWRTVDLPAGFGPRVAEGIGEVVFPGRDGTVAIVKTSWENPQREASAKLNFATGPDWSVTHHATGNADELFESFQFMGRLGEQGLALSVLQETLAMAETAGPALRLQLGTYLVQGTFGTPRDPARAVQLLQSAVAEGYGPARLDYARVLAAGTLGVSADPAQAEALARALIDDAGAEEAPPETQHSAAQVLFQGGFGVEADPARAVTLLLAAADTGHLPAQFDAGRVLIQGGAGIPADPARALALLQRAAEFGHPMAAALAGQIHEQGVGTPVDLAAAAKWYGKAVDLGFQQAASSLQRVQAATAAAAP